MRKIKIFFENVYYEYIHSLLLNFDSKNKRIVKRDVFIGDFILAECKRMKISDNVIAPRGISAILKPLDNDWFFLSLDINRDTQHHISKLKQIFVQIKNPITKKVRTYPLRFQDYKYINYTKLPLRYKVKITNKGEFVKLVDEEIKKLEYMPLFNTHRAGLRLLDTLEKKGFQIIKNS